MTTQVWWFVARATGIVGWALLAAAVILGLLLSTRLARGRPTPAWLLDMHRFLGGAAVSFTALHLGGLVADSYVHFGLADLWCRWPRRGAPGRWPSVSYRSTCWWQSSSRRCSCAVYRGVSGVAST